MACCASPNEGLKDLLKPFYQRATDAEDRLSKLEAVFSRKKEIPEPANDECNKKVKELELKLEEVIVELNAERAKVAKLTTENNKKDYRIMHLIRSIREAELKLEKFEGKQVVAQN